jgi:hypothetical protein
MSSVFTPAFSRIEANAQPLPVWLKDAAVDWMDEWGSPPRVKFLVDRDLWAWPSKVYTKDGNCYTALSGDGRMHQLWHGGPVAVRDIGDGRYVRCTTREEGFGGASYVLMLDDGQEITLRGPWAGGAPAGWNEVSYVDENASWRAFDKDRHWTKWTATAGVFFSHDLVVAALSRFCPQVRLALVNRHSGDRSRIEPLKPEWTEPKGWRRA